MPRSASPGADYSRPHSARKPRPAVSPKLTFQGSLGALQDLVLLTGIYGEWDEKPQCGEGCAEAVFPTRCD